MRRICWLMDCSRCAARKLKISSDRQRQQNSGTDAESQRLQDNLPERVDLIEITAEHQNVAIRAPLGDNQCGLGFA